MKKTMRGVIEPYTLGFLISLVFGGVAVFGSSSNDDVIESLQQIEAMDVVINVNENSAVE